MYKQYLGKKVIIGNKDTVVINVQHHFNFQSKQALYSVSEKVSSNTHMHYFLIKNILSQCDGRQYQSVQK